MISPTPARWWTVSSIAPRSIDSIVTPPPRGTLYRRAISATEGALARIGERLLATADVRIDGDRPWDIQIHDARMYGTALLGGSIAFGDGYVRGWWSCDDLEELAFRFASSRLEETAALLPGGVLHRLRALVANQQTRRRSLRVVRRHYNFGNDLFLAFLGEYASYSCGYFRDTDELDVAQHHKLDLICRKLDLRPGEHLLDVGGGWGELAHHAARHYGVRVTSINIAEEQMVVARERCRGLPVEIVRCDYRDVRGAFDKVAAIAMLTHVGYRNYRTFMATMRRVLKDDGILIIEGIWSNVSSTSIDAWVDKYIFPGAMLPSGKQTFAACEGLFVVEDLHNFGPDYVKTLRAWRANFRAAAPRLVHYGDDVHRIFDFYFAICAGYFRARIIQNWQLVLTPPGRAQPAARLS
jgi:cyclopropane-fatty-acyl-phospholipid synthase